MFQIIFAFSKKVHQTPAQISDKREKTPRRLSEIIRKKAF